MFVCFYNNQYLISLINAWCLDSGVYTEGQSFSFKV